MSRCPECRLRITRNSVQCSSCKCHYHAGHDKCAGIEILEWKSSWLWLDCISKQKPYVSSLSLSSPCTLVLSPQFTPRSRSRMSTESFIDILKDNRLTPKSIQSVLSHQSKSDAACQTDGLTLLASSSSKAEIEAPNMR